MLSLKRITKRLGGTEVLRSIDLDVELGRTLALIGPSGSGKSTLLRLMNGLLVPDAGSVHFGDEPIAPPRLLELRRRIGYVIQEGGLFPHLTALENVAIQARFLRWPEGRVRDRVGALSELTRLPDAFLDRYPAELSGGQRQRVSLMRALMLDPEVLLLDEPLGALDPMIRSELQVDLRGIFQSLRKSVVLVTHDLAEAAYFADRIVLLNEGEIVQSGSYQDLLEKPATPFVTRFVEAQRTIRNTPEESSP